MSIKARPPGIYQESRSALADRGEVTHHGASLTANNKLLSSPTCKLYAAARIPVQSGVADPTKPSRSR